MDMKTNLKVMIVVIAFLESESAALLRTPKVYNALITTDQNLTPSRVYPVLQPTFHDSPFYYGPYGYNFGHYYDPYGFNPFEPAPPLVQKVNTNFDGNGSSTENNAINNGVANPANGGTINNAAATGKAPIPLNEFGFPPSLVPIHSRKNTINLAPFPYNSYPLIYDQFNGYPQNLYLPHFGVLPQSFANLAGGANKNVNGNPNKINNSNNGKLPGPDVGQAFGENPNIANGNGPFDDNPAFLGDPALDGKIGLNGNPALDGPAGDGTGFNGNPFLPNNAAGGNPFLGNPAADKPSLENAANAPSENPFLGRAENSIGPKSSTQSGREGSASDGRDNNNNNNNDSESPDKGTSNPVYFDRENGVSQNQAAGAYGQNNFDGFGYYGDNSQKQGFESNANGRNIGANSRSASDSGFRQGSGIGSQNLQANGFQQESNSGSQSSQGANSQSGGSSSGFSRSSLSFQNSKRGNRQNVSESRINTNTNRNSAASINDNN